MITARNYAAQAEKEFKELSNPDVLFGGRIGLTSQEHAYLDGLAGSINRAVHFVVPDGGSLLDASGAGLIGQKLNLPYPEITIEYWSQKNQAKFLVVASQKDEVIAVTGASLREKILNTWLPCPIGCFLTSMVEEVGIIKTSSYFTALPSLMRNPGNPDLGLSEVYISTLIELLEALSCRNIGTSIHQEASSANARRVKAGKLPINETKMLVIDTKATVTASGEYKGGCHSSPRQHLRRGHIRRHATAGNIWVQSCVVGDPQKGTINKQYAIQ